MTMSGQRVSRLLLVVFLLATLAFYALPSRSVYAAQITNRSLTLEAGATDGGSKPLGVVKHFFQFTLPAVGNPSVGSIQFLYCTTASGSCTLPTGLVTTSATLGSQSGATSFTIVNTTNGSPYLTRSAASISAGQAVSYQLASVTNPGPTPGSFYVRISTFASTDTTGSAIDTGTVAASTAAQITLTGTMPESLIFCTGGTIGATAGIPDCSTATSGSVNFNQLFSPADTSTATTQMAASTNANSGYNITVNGTTLTSGSNTITAMSALDTSKKGVRQFGMNLRANTSASAASFPGTSADVTPAANGTNYRGEALAGYSTIDSFKFASADSIADSANTVAGPTDAQIYTISYIVNVSGGQPIGTYTTTLTYICTATF